MRNFFTQYKCEIEKQYKKVAEAAPAQYLPDFMFNAQTPVAESELRGGLPPRPKLEKLVARFFNSLDPFVQILHYKTFYARLEAYFADPTSQSIAWVGLLYATITSAMQSYGKIGDEPPEWKGELHFNLRSSSKN